MTLPYINHGRWVADCSCLSAEIVLPGQPSFRCRKEYGGCNTINPLMWPSVKDQQVVAAAFTPDVPMKNRNWNYQHGETVGQVIADIQAHTVKVV